MPILPAGTRQAGSVSYLDAGGERGPFHMWLPVVDDANYTAQDGFWSALLTQLDNMTLGNRIKDSYIDTTTYPVARPTNGAAREIALKIIFRSAATGQTWESVLPTLDVAKVTYDPNYGAKDVVLLTGTDVAALVTALNNITPKNPYDPSYTDNGVVAGMQVIRGQK